MQRIVSVTLNGDTKREMSRREQMLRHGLKHLPGRDTLATLDMLVLYFDTEDDTMCRDAVAAAAECLKDIRMGVRGGTRETPVPGPTAGAPY